MQTFRHIKISPAFLAAALVVLAVLPVSGCKNRLMFHPYEQMVSDPSAAGLSHEDVYFRTSDGIVLNGWWVASPGGRGTVLFCHGNAGNISFLIDTIRLINGMGLNVFVFDYRGFGRSGGSPSEEGTYRDAAAAWECLTVQKKIPPSKMIVVGRSLGGPVAAWLARHRSPAALVLESTFTRAADVANFHYRFSPGDLILGDAYDTAAHLARIRCPVLVIHSPEDEIVPYALGKQLYEEASAPREFLEIHGSHNGGFIQSQDRYAYGLRRFIDRYVH
jgi:uncharacterized protein